VLSLIEQFRVDWMFVVPTMLRRIWQLPPEVREQADLSSLRVLFSSGSPWPPWLKQEYLDWLGPDRILEMYGGTEQNGSTVISGQESLDHPGSVGKPANGARLRVLDPNSGAELPPGEIGEVYFETETVVFEYHNAPEKTKAAQHRDHANWTCIGDIGYLDDDGFLFLTDRKHFMIISGGVNIYPQEIENVLALHPAIHDVAVIGVPDPVMGESVKAFVQPAAGAQPGPELAEEIITFVKSRIASFKAPRSVQFVDELPRTEAGKLQKGELKKRYVTVP
jgi:fatty-acyl-CoA synthase